VAAYTGNTNYAPCQDTSMLLQKIYTLEGTIQTMNSELSSLREKVEKNDILPLRPIDGIEVVPKREVVLETEEKPLSFADRLLLNKKARKALEAEEMGETYKEEEVDEEEAMDVVEDEAQEVEEEAEEEVVEEEVEEVEEEEAEEEEEEELEEFDYKGSTYYRDSENNVFMTGDDGELNTQPIGKWNSEKQRIVMTRTVQ
jgi:hypothetical protein